MDSGLFAELARAEGPLVLVTILTVRGSAPRHPGTKMLVRADGSFSGTVGGGEGESLALARAASLMSTGGSDILDFEMLGRNPESTEAICGGVNTMLLESVRGEGVWRRTRDIIASGHRAVLARRLSRQPDGGVKVSARILFGEDGKQIVERDDHTAAVPEGEAGDSAAFDSAIVESCLASGEARCSPDGTCFYDPALPEEKLLILGGGHVGLALAVLALPLGFMVNVADDRLGNGIDAHVPHGVGTLKGSFTEIVENFPFDPSTYAVVLTRGHLHDLECLRILLLKEYRYLGFIGSARKTRLVLDRLEKDGFPSGKVRDMCAPIGLDIGAETPAEIAIAILAEMIAFRRNSALLASMRESRLRRRE